MVALVSLINFINSFYSENALSFVSIAVLTRFHTASRHPEVFLSTSDNSVVVVNTATTEMIDVHCRARIQSPIVNMSFAPNGRFLACFTQNSILTVISTSFETKVLDFDTSEGSSSPPLDMKWCGEDSVVLHWRKLGVLMVGPYGDWLRFPFDSAENLYIIPEVDCCRVITDHSVEILQRVPPATAALMRIGSIEPSAMLLDASDAFESGSPSSDETARAITKTGLLMEAVETCTDAALKEYDVGMQKRLLKAASYGMHFSYKDPTEGNIMGGSVENHNALDEALMPSETAIKFTMAARTLRILNALRDPAVGFILTAAQFEHITPTGVVARLVAMKRPALASSISRYLGLPKSVQLFARASQAAAFVASDKSKSDAETAEAAIRIINESTDKSKAQSGNSGAYATVALAANRAGRPGVANLLLMLESSVADKVPALIATGSFADAMAVATSARDAEFIFLTLMEYEKACMAGATDLSAGQNAFLGTVISKFTPEGFNTLRRYFQTMPDVKNVVNLLLRAQQSIAAGSTMAKKAMDTNTDPSECSKLLAESARIFSLGKDAGFHKSCIDDHLELLRDQEILRKKYNSPDVAPFGSSVTQTMNSVIRFAVSNKRESNKLLDDADKIARKFRLPEKRLWHIKVKALSESGQWPQLRILSDSKAKPPIGYKPFAMAAIRGGQNVGEIMRYVDRVSGSEERYELFCEARLWKRALDEGFKLRDTQRVANVKSLCDNSDVRQLCDEMMGRLAST
jgi:vacuolar protein sorting-associated protein 16